jgi:hypothetical protein
MPETNDSHFYDHHDDAEMTRAGVYEAHRTDAQGPVGLVVFCGGRTAGESGLRHSRNEANATLQPAGIVALFKSYFFY